MSEKPVLHRQPEPPMAQCLSLLKDVLQDDLLAMYLYGSSVVGGLQDTHNDIDLLAVANRQTTFEEKSRLATGMLKISGIYAVSQDLLPVDLTVVVQPEVNPWRYPPGFDFQYGEWLRKDFEKGNSTPWPTKAMPDLALLITQVFLASRTVYGPEPEQLLAPVPYEDFITATVKEMDGLMTDLTWDTRNVLLTFARMWSTVESDTIRSKPDAASWTMERLPDEYQPVMKRAKAICLGEAPEHWADIASLIKPCADFMATRIRTQIGQLKASGGSNRVIKIAG